MHDGLPRGDDELLRAASACTARAGLLAAGAVALAGLHLPGRPPTLCLLRATTGVPCPFCGGTTAAVELGHGHLAAALAASPLALGAALLLVLAPVLVTLPRSLAPHLAGRRALVVALVASELWQLHRFSLL